MFKSSWVPARETFTNPVWVTFSVCRVCLWLSRSELHGDSGWKQNKEREKRDAKIEKKNLALITSDKCSNCFLIQNIEVNARVQLQPIFHFSCWHRAVSIAKWFPKRKKKSRNEKTKFYKKTSTRQKSRLSKGLKKSQAWSVVYRKRRRSRSASIRKLSDNCAAISAMQGVSWNCCCSVSWEFCRVFCDIERVHRMTTSASHCSMKSHPKLLSSRDT